jgi:hypothetical protein
MYLLLLVFGAVLAAAGMILAGSAISLRDGSFDAAILTPAIVAAVGGLLLIGLGLGLQTLARIERVLSAGPMPRTPAVTETKPAESKEAPHGIAPSPFAPKVSRQSQSAVAVPDLIDAADSAAEPTSASDKTANATPAASQVSAAADAQPFGAGGNGAAAGQTALRFPSIARPAKTAERPNGPAFDTLWPKGPRPARVVHPAPAAAAASPAESENVEQASEAPPQPIGENATAVEVLKSGVVNGMPYTLYSDGSIEAQLAEGTLRFGSITELRNHLEQSA